MNVFKASSAETLEVEDEVLELLAVAELELVSELTSSPADLSAESRSLRKSLAPPALERP